MPVPWGARARSGEFEGTADIASLPAEITGEQALALDERRLSQTLSECGRRLDNMKRDTTTITNDIARLGQDFRNDKRFTNDSYSLTSEIRELERAVEKVKSRISSIGRANR
ncbi:hypothetical protein [Kribbella endophytica]